MSPPDPIPRLHTGDLVRVTTDDQEVPGRVTFANTDCRVVIVEYAGASRPVFWEDEGRWIDLENRTPIALAVIA